MCERCDNPPPEQWAAESHHRNFQAPAPWRRVYRDGEDITETVPPDQWPWPWNDDGRSSRSRR